MWQRDPTYHYHLCCLVVFINICFSTISETGLEQEDYHLPDREGPHSEIIYTVKDVSSVEQGQGGFVRAVRGNHFLLFIFVYLVFCLCLFPFTFKLLIETFLKRKTNQTILASFSVTL